MTAPRTLSADSVCAYTWIYSPKCYRRNLCALAHLPEELADLDWYELGIDARAALRSEIADIIEANASRQRAEWAMRAAA